MSAAPHGGPAWARAGGDRGPACVRRVPSTASSHANAAARSTCSRARCPSAGGGVRTPTGGRSRRITKGRLVGLDRSGPEPPATRRGQPLRPLTIPNLIRYARLAAIPVFLYLAFESEDGRSAAAAILYALIAGRRLPRWSGRAGNRPVQPHGGDSRPHRRQGDDPLRGDRVLALRAPAQVVPWRR